MTAAMVGLRRIDNADWEAVHAWARMPEASRFQSWGPNTPEQTREFVAAAVAAWGTEPCDRMTYLAELDGAVAGSGELRLTSRRHRQGEIQYIVHPRLWGRGVATAIGARLLRCAFVDHELHRVSATCDPRNLASAAVLRKLNMVHEGRLRHVVRLPEAWRDSDVYGVLSQEWRD